MLTKISQYLKEMLKNFPEEDSIIFNNKLIKINKNNFVQIQEVIEDKTIAFIDGGQAEIISAGNFCLSYIRVAAVTFQGKHKVSNLKKEFYLLTTAKYIHDELWYQSKIYGDDLINEKELAISSNDQSIKSGQERAPIKKVANMARRFAELALAKEVKADFIVLDGTLEATFKNEKRYLEQLGSNIYALAKSSSLFTTSGNSPVIVLNKIGSSGCWYYEIDLKTFFVKLHPKAKHVFRFEGDKTTLSLLIQHCSDPLFLGYPYGLIFVDRIARISNSEKKSLMMQFLLKAENKEITDYLQTSNAHDILDRIS